MSNLSKVKTKLVLLDPEGARKLLLKTLKSIEAGTFRQRPISETTVAKYVRDIRLGMWAASPQCIAVDVDGNVIDGRHRLEAIIQAGIPVLINLSTGWPAKQRCGQLELNTIDVIDRGRPRSVGSQLNIGHAIPNGNYHAAVAKTIAELCCDVKHVGLSVPQTLLILEIFQIHSESVLRLANNTRSRVSYICGPLAFCHAFNPAKTESFADKFFGLEGLSAGHPALSLVKWVQNHPRAASQERQETAKVVLSCVKAFTEGRKLSKCYASQDAWLWATSQQKENVRKVRQIVGIK